MNQAKSEEAVENADKKEIAEEEREKMLNEENERVHKSDLAGDTTKTHLSSPGAVTDAEIEPRKKIPIGGIKMPGFCRPRNKELEDKDKEDGTKQGVESSGDADVGILDAMKRPLVNVLASIKKNKTDGSELAAGSGGAGLASVETLGDIGEKPNDLGEDGMETVRLDGGTEDSNDDKIMNDKKNGPLALFISAARRNHLVTGTILIVIMIVIILICVACAGPRRIMVQPLKDGKYMEAVTWCGPVQGVLEDGGFAFRGIPYALPPVNNLRWRPAKSIDLMDHCWNGTYMALNSSNSCMFQDKSGQIVGDEDCLYLDVFTPQVRYHTPLPVVVMIGADSLSGGSPGVMQPSAKLARVRDMVFVRPNFRLGIFGFLSANTLSMASHPPTSGNYGLTDIIAVLNWVQLNIQFFGGDKDSVTIWGHRAGGTLVTALLAGSRRKIKGLFSRAWISSPSVVLPTRELRISANLSEEFLKAIQCSNAYCLRNKTSLELINAVPANWTNNNDGVELPNVTEAQNFQNYDNINNNNNNTDVKKKRKHEWLVVDGDFIQEDIYRTIQRDGSPVKLVIGTTAHSGIPLRLRAPDVRMNESQIEIIVKGSLLGTIGIAEDAIKRYNATIKGLASMISDIRVVCPIYNFTRAMNSTNVSFYVATQPRYNHLADVDSDVAAILGSYTPKTPEEKRHQSAIQQLFNQFVWHNRIIDAATDLSSYNNNNNNNDYKENARKTIIVGQDILPQYGYPNCDYWIKNDLVPKYARVD